MHLTVSLPALFFFLFSAAFSEAWANKKTCSDLAFTAAVTNGERTGKIILDRNCRYELTDTVFISKATSLQGNNASIVAKSETPAFRLLAIVTPSLAVSDVTFVGGKANEQGGGAIYSYPSNEYLSLSNTKFVRNSSEGKGGAVHMSGGELRINLNYFLANTAQGSGGAIYTAAEVHIGQSTEFERNKAAGNGGAIDSDKKLTISNTIFRNNESEAGGGAVRAWGELSIDGSRFYDNEARSGGAVYSQAVTKVSDALFVNNRLVNPHGSGVAILLLSPSNDGENPATHEVSHCTIVDDDRSMGTAITSYHKTEVFNSIIANYHFALDFYGTDGSTESHNLFVGNASVEANTLVNSTSIVAASAGFGPAYSLTKYSPAIDKGRGGTDNSSDIAMSLRPWPGSEVDIGAYEFRGNGSAAVSIEKEGHPYFVTEDVPVDFKLTIANNGLETATGLTVTDVLPTGSTLVQGSISDSGTLVNGALTWNIPSLAPGEKVKFQYQLNATQTLISRDYKVTSSTDPELVVTGSTVELPFKPNLVALSGFYPRYDGFRFPNWGNKPDPEPASDLTVADVETIFGRYDACKNAKDRNVDCQLRGTTSHWLDDWSGFVGGGHCAGMAMVSVDLFASAKRTPQAILDRAISFYDARRKNSDRLSDPASKALVEREFEALPDRDEQLKPGKTFDLARSEARRIVTLYATTQVETPVNDIGLLADGISRKGTDIVEGIDSILKMILDNSNKPEAQRRRLKLHFRQSDEIGGGGERSMKVKDVVRLPLRKTLTAEEQQKPIQLVHPFVNPAGGKKRDVYRISTTNAVTRNKVEEDKKKKAGYTIRNQQIDNDLEVFIDKESGQWLVTTTEKLDQALPGYGGESSQALYLTHNARTTSSSILNHLINNLSDPDAKDRYRLSFSKHPDDGGGGGHTVVPFAIERIGDSQDYLIYIYENNRPIEFDLAVKVNRQTGDWSYVAQTNPGQALHGYWGNNQRNNLRLTSWRTSSSFPKCPPYPAYCDRMITAAVDLPTGTRQSASESDQPDIAAGAVNVALNGEGTAMVTRSDGKRAGLDRVTGRFITEIPGATPVHTAFGLTANLPPQIRIPHEAGMEYSVSLQGRESATLAPNDSAQVAVSGPEFSATVTGINLSVSALATTDSELPAVGFNAEQKALLLRGGTGQGSNIGLAVAIDQDNGADITAEVLGINADQAQDVRLTFDETTQGLSISQGGVIDDSVTLEVKRINFDGTTDSHKAQTVLASGGTPLQVGLGQEWQAGRAPPVEGAGLLSGAVVFASVNYPDRVLSADADGGVQLLPRDQLSSDATVFEVEPSAMGDQLVTFRSANGYIVATPRGVQIQDQLGADDLSRASFRVRSPGLAGHGTSFESAEFTEYYLRHSGFVLRLHPLEDVELYRQDTTFYIVPPE